METIIAGLKLLAPVLTFVWNILIIIIILIFSLGVKNNKFNNIIGKSKKSEEINEALAFSLNNIEKKFIRLQNSIEKFEKFEDDIDLMKNHYVECSSGVDLFKNDFCNKCVIYDDKIKNINFELKELKNHLEDVKKEVQTHNEKLLDSQYQIALNLKESLKEAFKEVIKKK